MNMGFGPCFLGLENEKRKRVNDIMIDLETMAVTSDAAIISIGACQFDLKTGQIGDKHYYTAVTLQSNLDYERRILPSTLVWWMDQSHNAQDVFRDVAAVHLEDALVGLVEWMGDTCKVHKDAANVWGMGASFDTPMLEHAFTQTKIAIPWQFWNNKCARTYKNLPGAKDVQVQRKGVHHNALDDAVFQAEQVIAIHKHLFGKKAK